MGYELFYADASAAMGVRVVLEEIGADYELTDAIALNVSPVMLSYSPSTGRLLPEISLP